MGGNSILTLFAEPTAVQIAVQIMQRRRLLLFAFSMAL